MTEGIIGFKESILGEASMRAIGNRLQSDRILSIPTYGLPFRAKMSYEPCSQGREFT